MSNNIYTRTDSILFAQKVNRKIAGWYSNATFQENAVKRIVLQREEIYSLFEKVEAINVDRLLRYLDSSGFFYRPSSANRHHNFPGGLAEHSLGTFRIVEEWNSMTPDERQNSELYKRFLHSKQVTCDILNEKMNYDDMVIAAICHDLCKAKHYYMVGRVIKSHNSDPEPRHIHAALSVKRLRKTGFLIGIMKKCSWRFYCICICSVSQNLQVMVISKEKVDLPCLPLQFGRQINLMPVDILQEHDIDSFSYNR